MGKGGGNFTLCGGGGGRLWERGGGLLGGRVGGSDKRGKQCVWKSQRYFDFMNNYPTRSI